MYSELIKLQQQNTPIRLAVVGAGGGYIMSPSHNIQPDTPIENVLAVYNTVSERRK